MRRCVCSQSRDTLIRIMKNIDEARVRKMIDISIQVCGSQKAFAQKARISEQYLSDILKERRTIPEQILAVLGLERVTSYRRVDGGTF